MTVANVYGLVLPVDPALTSTGFSSLLMDASGEKVGVVLRAPKTGSIRKVHFRTGAVTTATDTDVRLETVDATTGHPTGTLLGTTTNVTVASASITANTWITTGALTADASVTRGDLLAAVIVPSGTPNYNVAGVNGTNSAFPYSVQYTASWADNSAIPAIALEYSDGSFAYIPNVLPFSAMNTHTFNNGSTPDERALKFRLAAPVRVAGVWFSGNRSGDVDFVLYDSDGTSVLASASMDKDVLGSALQPEAILFSSSVSLSANTYYRLAVKPTSATNMSAYSWDVASAAIMDQMAGGQDFHYSERTNAGAWTDTTTRRLRIGLIIDGIDDGAGGGGGGGPLIGGRLAA